MSKERNSKFETALLAAAAGAGFLLAAGNILYDYSINRDRKFYFGPRSWKKPGVPSGDFVRAELFEEALAWAEKTPITQFSATAFDGIPLNAYCFEQKRLCNRWLIAMHGYGKAAASLFPIAKAFYQRGFNTLLPESRGTGRSGGNCHGMGWLDRKDVLKWVYTILDSDPKAEIVLYGVSTGADAVMMAAGETLPSNVRCIIEDSGYSNLIDLSNHQLSKIYMGGFPFTFATSLVSTFRAGFSFHDASAVNQVAKSKTPILFIHGGQDTDVPLEMVYALYNVAQCPKEILVLPHATHGYGMYSDYETYWGRIWKFVGAYMRIGDEEGKQIGLVDRFIKK